MAPEVLPGRLGNLTADEQVKLREFWKLILGVFGTLGDASSKHGESAIESPSLVDSKTNGSANGVEPETNSTRGFWGWRRSSSMPQKPARQNSVSADVNETDKYGQTKEYHDALAINKPEDLRKAYWDMVKCEHPDGQLLRFLRARKWDIKKALVMLVSTLHWRLNTMRVDDELMFNGEGKAAEEEHSAESTQKKEAADFMKQLRMGKTYLHGTDKQGRPICTIIVRIHKIGAQSASSLEKLTVFTFEMAQLMRNPGVETACLVFDMTGFGLSNMDYTPLKFIIKCFEANYPECLGVVLVHKAPWIFQSFWKIIRGWLDPVVASKIYFTDSLADMEEFIERDRIPRGLGGNEDWEFEYPEPKEGENDRMKDTETRARLRKEREDLIRLYEDRTRQWLQSTSAEAESIAEERNRLAERIRESYWEMDRYIRARSMYDRLGLVEEEGQPNGFEEKAYVGIEISPEVKTG